MINKINKVEFICLYNKNKKYKNCLLNFNWDEFYTNADMNLAFKKSKEKRFIYKWDDIYKNYKIIIPKEIGREYLLTMWIKFVGKWVISISTDDVDKWIELELALCQIGNENPIANNRYSLFYIFHDGNPYLIHIVINPFQGLEILRETYRDIIKSVDLNGELHLNNVLNKRGMYSNFIF